MTLKNNSATFLCYLKLCASFCDHQSIWVKIGEFFCPIWPWNLTNDLENNMESFLCHFKLCASFRRHQSIQTGVSSRNAQFGSKSEIFCPVWPWNFMDELEKQKAPFVCYFKFVQHFIAICKFKLELQYRNAQIEQNLLPPLTLTFDLWPWPCAWTLFLSLVIAPENFMMTWWEEQSEKCERQTERWTDRGTEKSVLRAIWSQLKLKCVFHVICLI